VIDRTISHYKVLEKLGEGGMGVVYKAQDLQLERIVALKFLPSHVSVNDETKTRFLQEAKAAAALNHPNICTVYGIEESEGTMFIAMEFIDGGTLRDSLRTIRGNVTECVKVAVQIGDALQEAHAKGIVHRDIKADNVMLSAKGQAKVMDFGLAKLKGALKLTRTSSTVGTLGYMAPEQIQGGEVDSRSDIFSTGVLLFEMLTGSLPFRGEHEAAMMYSILNEAPDSIQNHIPDASADLSHILSRALEKDPDDRYQSMADMVSELRRLLKQTSRISKASLPAMSASVPASSASVPSSQGPNAPIPAKNKGMLLVAGIAAAAVVLIGGIYLFASRSSVELNPNMTLRILDLPLRDIDYPGLSGDGNWVTFTMNTQEGLSRVYLMNAGGGEPRAVVSDSGVRFESADLSFDASKIVYAMIPQQGIPGIYVTSALGGGTRLLADTAAFPRWQPDGSRVFFLRPSELSESGKMNVWSVSADGGDVRLEVEDALGVSLFQFFRYSLTVSPDGGSIAWIRTFNSGDHQEIMVIDRESKEIRQLTHDQKNIDEVCWTTNDQILFSSNRGGNINIWMIPAEGGEPQQITTGSGPDLGIRISRDNTKLLYYVNEEVGNLWVGSLKSAVARQVTSDDRVRISATLSPDGRQLAYAMVTGDALRPTRAIYISDRDGNNRRTVTTPGPDIVANLTWAPNGKRLAYASRDPQDSTQTFDAYLIDLGRPGAPKLLGEGSPFLWLDDDRILLSRVQGTLLVSTSTGATETFFEDSTVGFPVRGGTHVFYRDHHVGQEARWLVRVDGDFKPVEKPKKIMDIVSFNVSPDRDHVIYLDANGLWKVDLPSGRKQELRNSYAGLTPGTPFTINPQTQEILYSVRRNRAKLVMIENLFK